MLLIIMIPLCIKRNIYEFGLERIFRIIEKSFDLFKERPILDLIDFIELMMRLITYVPLR